MNVDGIMAELVKADSICLEKYSHENDLIVHLGVEMGGSLVVSANKKANVIGLDIFEDVKLILIVDERSRKHYLSLFKKNKNTFDSVKNALSKWKNITLFKSLTTDVPDLIKIESVDMLFIDADHSYEGASSDFNAWKKHIKIGGHILFHDSISVDNWAGVVKFVNELKQNNKNFKFIESQGSISVFKKVI